MRNRKLTRLLLLSSALSITVLGLAALPMPTRAACTSYAPTAGMIVTCSGTSNTSINPSADVTINFEDGAQHSVTGGGAMVLENSEINLYGSAAVTTSSTGLQINWSGSGNTNSTITLYGSSSVSSSGSGATIIVNGSHSNVILNDQSTVTNTDSGDAIAFTGTTTVSGSNTLIVGQNASVTATGSSADAVDFFLGSNTLINYGMLSSVGITVDGSNPSSTSDTIYNYGAITSSSGAAIALRGGNDRLTLGTGSMIDGSIDGGDGTDDLTLAGWGVEDSNFSNFESLTMAGTEWVLSGTSSFGSIAVDTGILRLNGAVTGDVQVAAGGTLGGTGTIYGDVTSFGTLSAGNSVGTATIVGDLVQTGGSFVEFDAGGVDRWDVTGTASLVNNPTLTVTSLDGSTTAYGVILHADGGIIGSFALPLIYDGNGAVSIEQTDEDIILTVVDGTSVVADDHASLQMGMSFFDHLGVNHSWRPGSRGPFWLEGFGQSGNVEAQDGNDAYEYSFGGTAAGWEAKAAKGMSLGASLGLSSTAAEVAGSASASSSRNVMGALSASFEQAGAFLNTAFGAGTQSLDLSHTAAVGMERLSVETDTNAWLIGAALQAGAELNAAGGWSIVPSVSLAYLHQWVEGYEEQIGSASAVIDSHDAGLLRLRGNLELRHFGRQEGIVYTPSLKLGVVDDLASGGVATGAFSNGTTFELSLSSSDKLRALGGIGLEAQFANGSSARLAYEGEASKSSLAHALTLEVKLYW